MKPKPLTAPVKADCNVERLTADCVHGTESCKCAKLDSDQVRVASIEGGFNYLSCLLEKQVGKHLNSDTTRCEAAGVKTYSTDAKGTRLTKALKCPASIVVMQQFCKLQSRVQFPSGALPIKGLITQLEE